MNKRLLFCFVLCFSILAACSNNSGHNMSSDSQADKAVEENSTGELANFSTENFNSESKQQEDSATNESKDITNALDRKVIYTADLHIEVKSYQKTIQSIQNQVSKFGGYIVESSMYEDPENNSTNGQITARIPQDKFQPFISIVEEGSSKVVESSTSGQDVTEEFVDLESRLKSKRVVEKRLISFMEDAKKTEDLLKISSDLAAVQEEIEEITGRMKYLQNKSDLATVSIYIQENDVKLSGTGKDQLNTWDKTQQQFMKSINFLITAFSTAFIFLVGNLPILIIAVVIGSIVFLIIKKRKNNNSN